MFLNAKTFSFFCRRCFSTFWGLYFYHANTAYNTKQSIYVIIFVHVGLENHVIKLVLNTYMVNVFMGAKTVETRNTVSNAHKMIPPLPNVLYGKVLVLLWETPKSFE